VAGEKIVGRIYQHHASSQSESWWWGLNTITFDSSIGPAETTKGYAHSLPEARAAFRTAFDRWVEWGLALPQWDPKRRVVAEQLKRIGVWPSADLRPQAFSLDRLDIAAAHTFENNKRRHTAEGRHASNAVHVARAGPQ
jgi:hypothetical protein